MKPILYIFCIIFIKSGFIVHASSEMAVSYGAYSVTFGDVKFQALIDKRYHYQYEDGGVEVLGYVLPDIGSKMGNGAAEPSALSPDSDGAPQDSKTIVEFFPCPEAGGGSYPGMKISIDQLKPTELVCKFNYKGMKLLANYIPEFESFELIANCAGISGDVNISDCIKYSKDDPNKSNIYFNDSVEVFILSDDKEKQFYSVKYDDGLNAIIAAERVE